MSFFAELKRRHVYRVAIAYVVSAWLVLQLGSILFPAFEAPAWAMRLLFGFLMLGFLIAILLAWAFEVTPEGVRRTEPVGSIGAGPAHRTQRIGRGFTAMIIVILLAAVGVLGWRQLAYRPAPAQQVATAPSPAGANDKSIAVLPFESLSADKNNTYFADGIRDLILTKLAGVGDLKVISRASTAKYASYPNDLKTIAQQLGVATILEGSVQKAGNQVLISVRLIDTRTDTHVWAQSYRRTLDNIFDVEGEVAGDIAQALDAKLSPAESARLAAVPTTNEAAYDLFLRAEYLVRQSDVDYGGTGYKAAIPLYRQAIAQDPNFALAHARLSYAESGVVWFGSGADGVEKLIADAHAQAERALALQPDLVAGHIALGFGALWFREDYPAALQAFEAVLELRPNDAEALELMGVVRRRQGHFGAAIEKIQQALALDPRNSELAYVMAETCAAVGRNAEAGRFFRRALALDPDNYQAKYGYSALILFGTGDVARALDAAQGDAPRLRLWRVQLLTLQRKYPEALALRAAIPDTLDNFFNTGSRVLTLADLYRLMGDTAHARPLYAQALSQLHTQLTALVFSAIKLSFVWNRIASAELGLGRTDDALAAIAKSQALAAQSGNRFFGPWIAESNAARYAQAGRADLAVPLLSQALATPGIGLFYSPVLLWLDPAWDPIRHDPRFHALRKKYAKYKPARAGNVVPASSDASGASHG
jgi:TolB-like protein/predicted TPR repeat methyltransferase